jgi:hypothetical protein
MGLAQKFGGWLPQARHRRAKSCRRIEPAIGAALLRVDRRSMI